MLLCLRVRGLGCSKSDGVLDVEAVWPYYQSLIDKYMPGKLEW